MSYKVTDSYMKELRIRAELREQVEKEVRADERERCIEAILDVHTYKGTSADNVEQRNIVEYRNELIKAINEACKNE